MYVDGDVWLLTVIYTTRVFATGVYATGRMCRNHV